MQRSDEKNIAHYVDVYDVKLFPIIILIVVLCVADAYFTLLILSKGGTELNPVMEHLLGNYSDSPAIGSGSTGNPAR